MTTLTHSQPLPVFKKKARPSSFWRRARRGQAMVEYSIVAHALLIGGAVLLLPMISLLLESIGVYFESIYFVLKSGAM